MMGFGRIALIPSSVALTATSCHASYPLNSESATPFSALTLYLSCAGGCTDEDKEQSPNDHNRLDVFSLHLHSSLFVICSHGKHFFLRYYLRSLTCYRRRAPASMFVWFRGSRKCHLARSVPVADTGSD